MQTLTQIKEDLIESGLKENAIEIFKDRDIDHKDMTSTEIFDELISQINKRDMDSYDAATYDAGYYYGKENTYQELLNTFRQEIMSDELGQGKKYTSESLEIIIENLMK